MGSLNADEMKKELETKAKAALYRCQLSCKIGKDACEGIRIPEGVEREDWLFYQLFDAIQGLAEAMTESFK